jgi:hypothetical protein
VAPITIGTIVHFRFHIRFISIHNLLYFSFFSAFFCTTFLSAGIATSISLHVFSFLFLNYYIWPICCNFSVCVYCLIPQHCDILLLLLLLLLLVIAQIWPIGSVSCSLLRKQVRDSRLTVTWSRLRYYRSVSHRTGLPIEFCVPRRLIFSYGTHTLIIFWLKLKLNWFSENTSRSAPHWAINVDMIPFRGVVETTVGRFTDGFRT